MKRMHRGWVVAAALLAGAAPSALVAAPAVAATAPVAAEAAVAAEVGTVVQDGARTRVPAGVDDPATLRFTAAPAAGTTGPLTARVELLDRDWDTGGMSDYRVGALFRSTCSVAGGPAQYCGWSGTSMTEPGPGRVVLDLPVAPAADRIAYAVTLDLDEGAEWLGGLDASVTLKDAAGTVVAGGRVGFDVVKGTPYRPLLFGRDRDGVLWSYMASRDPAAPLDRRVRVGGGWQQYTAIVPLNELDTSGLGGLVARDRAGVLWFYKGTNDRAAPFEPRVRIGGGWNAYTAFTGIRDSLVARDADGVLWHYVRDHGATGGAVFEPRVRVGGGWNTYDALTSLDDGALARDKAGVLWKYERDTAPPVLPSRPYERRNQVGGGWQVYTAVVGTGDLHGGHDDVVARDARGRLWMYRGEWRNGGVVPTTRTLVGGGWNTYDLIF